MIIINTEKIRAKTDHLKNKSWYCAGPYSTVCGCLTIENVTFCTAIFMAHDGIPFEIDLTRPLKVGNEDYTLIPWDTLQSMYVKMSYAKGLARAAI
jgi:hypothetical protein